MANIKQKKTVRKVKKRRKKDERSFGEKLERAIQSIVYLFIGLG